MDYDPSDTNGQDAAQNMGSDQTDELSSADRTTSPVRPQNPNPPKPKINPALARPSKPEAPRSTAEMLALSAANQNLIEKAEEALENLSQKMATLSQEYAEGKINQAQFNAIYRRYSEQRDITERLLQRNPDSPAWQSVMQPGHTGFLRDYFSAKITSYGIYSLKDGRQITLQGGVRLPQGQLLPIIAKIKQLVEQGHKLGPAWRQLKDENWVLIVPGKWTMAVVIFSLEPAVIQRKKVEDAQRDFERANEKVLQRGEFDPEGLVFPHRALLETTGF